LAQLSFHKVFLGLLLLGLSLSAPLIAQTTAPAPPAARTPLAYASLAGRPVEDVRVLGNTQVSSAIILNVVRTRPGDRFDPATVEEDYQRIYGLKKFANVEAKAEPTAGGGVVVTFIVTEQKQIRTIRFKGNTKVETQTLKDVVDIAEGEAIDSFRLSIARQAIVSLYQTKNYPYANVDFDRDLLARTGELVFIITEGPNVRVRKVEFFGNQSFSDDRLKDQVQTKYWIWIFRPGTFDRDTLDDDVAALRRFYESKGFFDVKVGRKVTESPEQSEVRVTFLIDEGPRYTVDKVTIRGNKRLSEQELLSKLKLVAGRPYDGSILQRDVREIVRAYSPFGFIYQPGSDDPNYLRIGRRGEPVRRVFQQKQGHVELIYDISEGKPFKLGRIIVKGNARTQDKVVLREMRVTPGEQYNAAEIADATDRLRASPYFQRDVTITPIGDDPDVRDVIVEVTEARTATFGVGAVVNSNGGLGANITYEQRNFDISNWPDNWGDVLTDRSFIGAGQILRMTLEPGTRASNASIRFTEPWIFDQPYSFTGEAYWRDRVREHWDETRAGGRVTFGKRWNYVWSTALTLRGEDMQVSDIEDEDTFIAGQPLRAQEVLDAEGHTTITSAAITLRRDTTNHGVLTYRGTNSQISWESYGVLGGPTFQKFTTSFDWYTPLNEDLLDRRTIFALRGDAGWIWGDAPFFERFYAGGIGTVRGFRFRGISPRGGLAEDPIGGDFSLTGSAEISFPITGDNLRGVIFADAGTVERELEIGTIRTSVGFGFRLVLPVFQGAPVALDFALPLTRDDEDDTEWFSFSLGINP
jgi:outer membrane protein insertion porin family